MAKRKPAVHLCSSAWAFEGPVRGSACGASAVIGATGAFKLEAVTCQKCIDAYWLKEARLREMAEARRTEAP